MHSLEVLKPSKGQFCTWDWHLHLKTCQRCETFQKRIQQKNKKVGNNTTNSNDSIINLFSSWPLHPPPPPLNIYKFTRLQKRDFHWPHCHSCVALSLIPWPYMLISSWHQRCSSRKLLGRASLKTPHWFVIWRSLKLIHTWNPKHPFINGCFNWMIPNLYTENGCLTKHQFQTGCLGFQVLVLVCLCFF